MRTTLTLEDDVAAKLKAESKRSGRSLKEIVNEYLRLGFHAKKSDRKRPPFRVHARDMGELRPGLSLDNIGELLEQIEGSTNR
ncbi:MAG: ribbon-helix-helix protein, CopG family [Acidobacteria bacterium]|nr:MAG: ribbon-helix-helix protein, CopG family [Acidobacteriota bacterium]